MEGDAVLLLVKGEVEVGGRVNIGKYFVQPNMSFSEKELVAVSDGAAAEALRDLHYVHYAVNQS